MAATGSFASVCSVLNKISRTDNGYSLQERVAALRTLFDNTLNAPTGVGGSSTAQQRLATLLHLLLPGMDATPRRLELTSTAVRNMFYEAVTGDNILPEPPQGWPSSEYDAPVLEGLRMWPLGAAQESVNRFIDGPAAGDRRGVRIADVSEYIAAACPYGVPPSAVEPTDKIKDTVNEGGLLTIFDVQKLVMKMKTAYPSAIQRDVLTDFLTGLRRRDADAVDVPWNAEWRWFVRIILRRMYANVREKRTLDALHPMAWPFSDLQHDIDSIARAFVSPVQFPYETEVGRQFRVMRCNTLSFIPLVASTLNPSFISKFGTTASMSAHIVGNYRGAAKFLLGHSWMTEWRDVADVAREAVSDRRMAWLGKDDSVSQGDSAVEQLTTKAEHMITIRFHGTVLRRVFPTPGALEAVLKHNTGFTYAIMLYNAVHKAYEYILPHRMWTLLQRDLAVPPGTQIHVLPRGLLRRLIKDGKKANLAATEELQEIVAAVNESGVLPLSIALSERAVGNVPVFDATPDVKGFLIEEKYDGDRMQLHLRIAADGTTPVRKFYTRGGYDRTQWYNPVIGRVLEAIADKGVEQFIVDGEIVEYDNVRQAYAPWGGNRRVAQQENAGPLDTRQRGLVMLHEGPSDLAEEEPVTAMDDPRFGEVGQVVGVREPGTYTVLPDSQLCFVVFDILHLNGQDLVSLPLYRRREILEGIFPPHDDPVFQGSVEVSRGRYGHSAADVITDLEGVVKRQGEGLVVKDPFTPYRGGQSVYWQKVKAHSDTVDMAIVGFGFQVASDLASTGDPHISSFTVAVRDAKKPSRLLTVCEVPFFTVSLRASDDAKAEYLQHSTAVRVDEILAALRSAPQQSDYVQVKAKDGVFTLYAKRLRSRKVVVLKWESSMTLVEPVEGEFDPLVYYDDAFTNIQVVAHPFLVSHSIAVYGDYRVNEGYGGITRFTSPLTIRFPRGTLRQAKTKQPHECDTTAKLEDLKLHAETDPVAVLAADIRRVHRVLPTGLKDDAADEVIPDEAKSSVPKREMSIDTLRFANETDLVNASGANLVEAMKKVNQRWPTPAAAAKRFAAANDSPATSPLPSPRSPPSRAASSPPLSPLQFVSIPIPFEMAFDSPAPYAYAYGGGRNSPPPRVIPPPPEPGRYAMIVRQLDAAIAQMEHMVARAEKAVKMRGAGSGIERPLPLVE